MKHKTFNLYRGIQLIKLDAPACAIYLTVLHLTTDIYSRLDLAPDHPDRINATSFLRNIILSVDFFKTGTIDAYKNMISFAAAHGYTIKEF